MYVYGIVLERNGTAFSSINRLTISVLNVEISIIQKSIIITEVTEVCIYRITSNTQPIPTHRKMFLIDFTADTHTRRPHWPHLMIEGQSFIAQGSVLVPASINLEGVTAKHYKTLSHCIGISNKKNLPLHSPHLTPLPSIFGATCATYKCYIIRLHSSRPVLTCIYLYVTARVHTA